MDFLSQSAVWLAGIADTFAFDSARLTEPDILARLVLQFVLLAASAFFSSSETALFSLSQFDLQKLRREHLALLKRNRFRLVSALLMCQRLALIFPSVA